MEEDLYREIILEDMSEPPMKRCRYEDSDAVGELLPPPIKRFTVFFQWEKDIVYSVQILFVISRNRFFINGLDLAAVLSEDWQTVCSQQSILDYLPRGMLKLGKALKMLAQSSHPHAQVFGRLLSSKIEPNSLEVIEFRREADTVSSSSSSGGGGILESWLQSDDGGGRQTLEKRQDEISIVLDEQEPYKFYCTAYRVSDRLEHTFCQQVFALIAPSFEMDSMMTMRESEEQTLRIFEYWLVHFKRSSAISRLNEKCSDIRQNMDRMRCQLYYYYDDDDSNGRSIGKHIDTCMENIRNHMMELSSDPDPELCCGMRVVYYCEYVRQLVHAVRKDTGNERLVQRCFKKFKNVFISDGYLDDLKRYFGPRQLC